MGLEVRAVVRRELRRRRPRPTARWHLDGMAVTIAGRRFWLWRALDARTAGFETFIVEDACRAIDADGFVTATVARLE